MSSKQAGQLMSPAILSRGIDDGPGKFQPARSRIDEAQAKVTAFSEWLSSHKIQATAAVTAVVGLVLIGKGIAAL